MGVITTTLAVAAAYIAMRVAAGSLHAILKAALVSAEAILSVGRTLGVLSHPPGSSLYSGPPTTWDASWYLLTLGPLRATFAPGSFVRSYAVLVVPALVVIAVACLALLARSSLVIELAEGLWRGWRRLLGLAACLIAATLADDAVRRYAVHLRLFPAAFLGSGAALLGFLGLVGALGPEETGGLSGEQVAEWLWALGLLTIATTCGIGGATLLLAAASMPGAVLAPAQEGSGAAAVAAAAATSDAIGAVSPAMAGVAAGASAADHLAFMLYGSLLSLAAAAAASCYTESSLVWRVAWRALKVADALLRVRPLVAAVARAVRRLRNLRAVKVFIRDWRRADEVVTVALTSAFRAALDGTRSLCMTFKLKLGPLLRDLYRSFVAPAGRVVWRAFRATLPAVRAFTAGAYRRVLLPAAIASWSLACTAHAVVLRPLAVHLTDAVRHYVTPLLWPAGTLAGTAWFARQAAAERALLPYGAAAYVSALISCLMIGKLLRKTKAPALHRAGTALELLAARAYLHLDLGAGGIAGRVLVVTTAATKFVVQAALATGRRAVALLAGPVVALLTAVLTALAAVTEAVSALVLPWVVAAYGAARDAVKAIWEHPEWALAAAAAVLAAAYGAHRAGLPAAVWRSVVASASAALMGVARLSLRLLAPALGHLVTLASQLASLLGLSAAFSGTAARGASRAIGSWGNHAASDVSLLFESPSFAAAFLGLNLFHAMLLKAWALPALVAQGEVGRSATVPIISFVARSTGKVALGPMYLIATAALVTGGLTDEMAAGFGSLTAPTLWFVYLLALWVEGGRRVSLSYDSSRTSEFAKAMRAVRSGASSVSAPAASPASATNAATSASFSGITPHLTAISAPASFTSSPRHGPRNIHLAASAPPRIPAVPVMVSPTAQARATAAPAAAPQAAAFLAGSLGPAAAHLPSLAQGSAATHSPPPPSAQAPDSLQSPASSSWLSPSQRLLLHQIRAQGSSSRVFTDGICPICIEELWAEGEAKPGCCGERPPRPLPPLPPDTDPSPDFAVSLRCGHAFHVGCVLKWLQSKSRCPVCREPAVGVSRHTNMLF